MAKGKKDDSDPKEVEEEPEKAAEPEKPSKEELERAVQAARDEIKQALAKRKTIDRNLATLESTLYAFETSYLNPTTAEGAQPSFGNIVKGYDQFLKAPNAMAAHHTTFATDRTKRRAGMYGSDVREEERLFSRSSETYLLVRRGLTTSSRTQSLDLKDRDASAAAEEEDDAGSDDGGPKKKQKT